MHPRIADLCAVSSAHEDSKSGSTHSRGQSLGQERDKRGLVVRHFRRNASRRSLAKFVGSEESV